MATIAADTAPAFFVRKPLHPTPPASHKATECVVVPRVPRRSKKKCESRVTAVRCKKETQQQQERRQPPRPPPPSKKGRQTNKRTRKEGSRRSCSIIPAAGPRRAHLVGQEENHLNGPRGQVRPKQNETKRKPKTKTRAPRTNNNSASSNGTRTRESRQTKRHVHIDNARVDTKLL